MSGQCKLAKTARGRRRCGGAFRVLLLSGLAAVAALSACGPRSRSRAITVRALEEATPVEPRAVRRAVVADTAGLKDFYCPLGRRLGLVQLRSEREWEALRRYAPELGSPPDFGRGAVVGLMSHAGVPLNGNWPIQLETVRLRDGAGFVVARFQGGSFLPDGSTYLETAQIDGLAAVLMVEVNGVRFYPN